MIKRLLLASESGLVLVIILMALGLTVFGGSKPGAPVSIPLPSGSTVTTAEGVTTITLPGAATEALELISRVRSIAAEATGGNVQIVAAGRSVGFDAGRNPRVTDGPDAALMVRPMVNKFLDVENLVLVGGNASYFAIMAVGMTAVIIMGGIDLSVGSIYALAAIAGAMALRWANEAWGSGGGSGGSPMPLIASVPLGLAVCCGVGALAGAFNGAMIVGLRVHPFIITLGTMAVYRGSVFVATRSETISELPDSFTRGFFKLQVGGVYPVPTFLMVLVVLAGVFVLARTVLARRAYAIGGNETAARYAGIPVSRVKVIFYTLSGMLAGLSACAYIGYYGAAAPAAGDGYELDVVAAAVIGGASLSGGRGSALGAVLGAIMVQLISNAMVILEIDQSYQKIVMGSAIIAAVVIDQTKARLSKARGAAG